MKQIVFLLLIACSLQAQTTTRTFILSPDLINYFEVTRTTQDDGTYTETAAIVGPSVAIAADQADKIEAAMRALAQSAFQVSFAAKNIRELSTTDSIITAQTTISPLKIIQDRYRAELLKPGRTVDQGAGFLPIVFTINGQGNLRYSINGAATKAAAIYGTIIRLNGFPATGANTDLYLSENGSRYFSLPNRSQTLKKP